MRLIILKKIVLCNGDVVPDMDYLYIKKLLVNFSYIVIENFKLLLIYQRDSINYQIV
jgi:hypothetical protein